MICRKLHPRKIDSIMKRILLVSGLIGVLLGAGNVFAAGDAGHIEDISFSYEGPFGTFDPEQLQRGLVVYQEVCAACHGLKYVPLRTLGDKGGLDLSESAVKSFARSIEMYDPELEDYREALPTDNFPANDSVGAPDLSLITKARAGFHGPEGTGMAQLFQGIGGPEYVYSLLVGYTGEEKEEAGSLLYGNTAFSGGYLSMAPPLSEGMVEFADGTPSTVERMAEDVTAFLVWAAEPKMMARKQMGLISVSLLILLSILLYLTNKKLWAPIKYRKKAED